MNSDRHLADWNERQQAAEEMVPLVGALWRNHGVPTYVYGTSIYLKNPIEIIKAHRATRQLIDRELSPVDVLPVLRAVSKLDLTPAAIDVGKLWVRHESDTSGRTIEEFVGSELAHLDQGAEPLREEPQDVVLYGFGRIGRLLTRILVHRMGAGDKFRLRAIVVRRGGEDELEKRASLLRRDSVHGPFSGTIVLDEKANALIVNGNVIRIIHSDAPEKIDYRAHGIEDAVLIDNTGRWRDRAGLENHLKAKGISKVILTAPGKGDLPNIVFGVNQHEITDDKPILTAASCTTNAIGPALKAINERFGIVSGHIESVHSYTNDQNLIDNYHPKKRRGRSAALNMVITETGAAKAISKALPELHGKLTGNAIRVPTPNVSLAILNLTLEKEVSVETLNGHLRQASLDGPLRYQLDYTTSPDIVSSDIVGNRHAGVVDSTATIVQDGRCVLYVWYDNEYGYACQVIRMLEKVAGVRPRSYPE